MADDDWSCERAHTSKPRVYLSDYPRTIQMSSLRGCCRSRKGSTLDEVLGDQAILLGDPQECTYPTSAAQPLLNKAVVDPLNTRAFIVDHAVTLAAGCACV